MFWSKEFEKAHKTITTRHPDSSLHSEIHTTFDYQSQRDGIKETFEYDQNRNLVSHELENNIRREIRVETYFNDGSIRESRNNKMSIVYSQNGDIEEVSYHEGERYDLAQGLRFESSSSTKSYPMTQREYEKIQELKKPPTHKADGADKK